MNILVTGAAGFVGTALCKRMAEEGLQVTAAHLKRNHIEPYPRVTTAEMDPMGPDGRWENLCQGQDAVIHLAARVHVMKESSLSPLNEYRAVNTQGTARLARQAAQAGVRRFVYLSTVKVNGESTRPGAKFEEIDLPAPQDPYGISKWEAELTLKEISRETGMEVVIIRPPLVYGVGVKGNFLLMLKALQRKLPLPLGGLNNLRSLIYLGNLVEALRLCILHPVAAGKTYLVSDGQDVSTSELLRKLCHAMGVPARIIPVPEGLILLGGTWIGRRSQVERLTSSLVLDNSRICQDLQWQPPFSLDEGLLHTATWFLKN